MKCLNRNKSSFYYALYDNKFEILDEYGNNTGQYEVKYMNPVEIKANISAAMGNKESRQFGDSVIYDKVIVLDNVNIIIDEYSILWIDTIPVINEEDGTTTTPHDYVVTAIAKSLNSVSIAVSKVKVQ